MRSRGFNDLDLYLFKMTATDTNDEIEIDYSAFARHFTAKELNDKSHSESDVLFGRVRQSTTVQRYITNQNMGFEIGDNIAEIPNPTEHQMSTIQNIIRQPAYKRASRHNKQNIYHYIIEVS